MEKENYSDTIYVMKAFAIFSVLVAHINKIDNTTFIRSIITNWYNLYGIVGVICFFIIGGYFYKRKESDSKQFWNKKIRTIIIPWLIASSITYSMHVIKMNDLNLVNYLKWIFGSGTIYYYVANYVLFLVIFKFIEKNDIYLIICILLTVIQSVLNTNQIYLTYGFITKYLNIFNWIGFFALGILIQRYNFLDFLISKKFIFIISSVLSLILFVIMHKNVIYGYFHILSLLYEIVGVILVFYLSYVLSNNKLLIYIGKISFCIYLYHIQIVQKFCWKLPVNVFTILINPFLGLIIMIGLIYICSKIITKFKFKDKIYSLVGLR